MNVLLVGEAPNASGHGRMANTTQSGRRIAALGGEAIPRTNVIQRYPGSSGKGAAFPRDLAVAGLRRLWRRTPRHVAFVYMGKRVAAADGHRGPYLQWAEHRGRLVCTFPHPSGINRWWNEPANVELARLFLRGCAAMLPPSTTSDKERAAVTHDQRTHFKMEVNDAVRRRLPLCGACKSPLGSCDESCPAFGSGEERVAGSNTRRWTDGELTELLRELGVPSRKQYAAERRRRGGSIPAESSLMRRFGSWQNFVALAAE